jgi:ornithine cyclodeaminase
MSAQLGIPVMPAESGPAALAGAHIVNVITRSVTPVIDGDWLEPGQHVNAAGSNALDRREIDSKTIARAALISVDSKATARNECGDLLPAIEQGQLHWDALTEIGDIMVGRAPGRAKSEDITLYQSHGMGIQDLYVGIALLAIAQREGLGSMLAMA